MADWDVAEKLGIEAVMVGRKKCKVELWGQSEWTVNKKRLRRFPTPPLQYNVNKRPGIGNSIDRGFRCYSCGEGAHFIAQ